MNQSTIKKVLMTADTVGGVWTYAVELIRAYERHGIHVLLATMGRTVAAEQREDLDKLRNVDLMESEYRLEWMDDPWRDVAAAGEWLLALEQAFEPDLVHLNGYAHGALPWIAPRIVVAHSCVLSWWRAVHRQDAPDTWREYYRQVQAGLSAADLVIAPTRAMLNCLIEHYGQLSATEVIPNGRRLDLFEPQEKENYILSAGRLWDEAKNVRAVCAGSFNLSWPVFVAGETESPEPGAISSGAASGKVHLLGRLTSSEVLDQMAKARIFAHPAKYEPFGLSVLEAALSGCALMLGDIPALRENWSNAAIFVDPRDHDQLRRALTDLIDRPDECARLGDAARQRGAHFDIEHTAARYIDAYSSLRRSRDRLPAREREECVAA